MLGGNAISHLAAKEHSPIWTIPLYSEAPQANGAESANPGSAESSSSPAKKLAQPTINSLSGIFATPLSHSQTFYSIGLFGKLVEVPDVRGKTWSEAKLVLAQKNLVAIKANNESRNDDVVRNQNVIRGKKVFPGTSVKLSLVAEVPNVVGLTLSAAYEVLEAENSFPMKYNAKWPSDLKVTVQDPKAGAKHSRGRDVEVASMVQVPKLRGITIQQAKQSLTDSNLYAEISTDFFLDEDRVLRQSPRAGKMAPALSKVTLIPGAEVPDLIGLTSVDADRALRPSGIQGKPTYRQVATFDSLQHGRTIVENQSLRSGNYVARGTSMRVNLVQYVYRQQVIVLPPRRDRRDRDEEREGNGGQGGGGLGGG